MNKEMKFLGQPIPCFGVLVEHDSAPPGDDKCEWQGAKFYAGSLALGLWLDPMGKEAKTKVDILLPFAVLSIPRRDKGNSGYGVIPARPNHIKMPDPPPPPPVEKRVA